MSAISILSWQARRAGVHVVACPASLWLTDRTAPYITCRAEAPATRRMGVAFPTDLVAATTPSNAGGEPTHA